MKIYIAGKITGLSGEEAEGNFMWNERLVEQYGHEPLNPMKLVDQSEGREYEEYLTDALRIMLTEADGVLFLANWRDASDGAAIEHFIASRLPKFRGKVFYSVEEIGVATEVTEEDENPFRLTGDELERTEAARKAGQT